VYKLCRVDIERSKDLFDEVKAFAKRLKEIFPVREVYVYGSFANREVHEGSDIDLLIVGDFKERLFERIGKILDLTDLPIEPLVYTIEEFEELKSSHSPFIAEVLKTAVRL
jgi:predicted nucleotidyltransferase